MTRKVWRAFVVVFLVVMIVRATIQNRDGTTGEDTAPPVPDSPIDHVGVHRQRDGLNYVGVAPVAGRVTGSTLVAVAKAAERAGSRRVRTTAQQKLVVLDVPDADVDQLVRDILQTPKAVTDQAAEFIRR